MSMHLHTERPRLNNAEQHECPNKISKSGASHQTMCDECWKQYVEKGAPQKCMRSSLLTKKKLIFTSSRSRTQMSRHPPCWRYQLKPMTVSKDVWKACRTSNYAVGIGQRAAGQEALPYKYWTHLFFATFMAFLSSGPAMLLLSLSFLSFRFGSASWVLSIIDAFISHPRNLPQFAFRLPL